MEGIAFGTDGWRTTLDEFTVPRIHAVGRAVAQVLSDSGIERPIAVGYDARATSRDCAEELASELAANGVPVLLSERDRPTPLYAYGVVDRNLAGALIITASHNPPEYNGIKFIPEDGAPALPGVMEEIASRLSPVTHGRNEAIATIDEVDFVTPHATACRNLISVDLTGTSIVYDAMYGSGRGTTDSLLESVGASVERLRCTKDPDFGGSSPNPTADNLSELISRVRETHASLGIANDGDADRIAVVTPERGYINPNILFATLYEYLLEDMSGPAVRTVSTSYLIDKVASAHNESVIEVPVGFKWVAAAMAEHDAVIGGEESGGFSIAGHVREKDGVMTALLVAAMDAEQPLDDRIDQLIDTHGSIIQNKRSIECTESEKQPILSRIESDLPETLADIPVESVNTADGCKFQLADGSWVLIRPSGTEPALRIYAESTSESTVSTLLDAGESLIGAVR